MKTVDIVFTKSKKKLPIGSWAIRAWTWKPYSHVACGVTVSDWGMNYFQSSEGKVNYEHEPYFNEKHEIVRKYTLELTDEAVRQLKKDFYQSSGIVYGTMQNIGILWVDLVKVFTGKTIDNPWKKGKNCSELIYEVVINELYPDVKGYNPDTIKPHHIEDILISKGHPSSKLT